MLRGVTNVTWPFALARDWSRARRPYRLPRRPYRLPRRRSRGIAAALHSRLHERHGATCVPHPYVSRRAPDVRDSCDGTSCLDYGTGPCISMWGCGPLSRWRGRRAATGDDPRRELCVSHALLLIGGPGVRSTRSKSSAGARPRRHPAPWSIDSPTHAVTLSPPSAAAHCAV